LKCRLDFAEKYIKKLHENPNSLGKKKRKQTSLLQLYYEYANSSSGFPLGITYYRADGKFKDMVSRILFGMIHKREMPVRMPVQNQSKALPASVKTGPMVVGEKKWISNNKSLSAIKPKQEQNTTYEPLESMTYFDKLNVKSLDFLNDASLKYQVKKYKVKQKISGYLEKMQIPVSPKINFEKIQDETNEILKETTKTMCPVIFAKKAYSLGKSILTNLSYDYQLLTA